MQITGYFIACPFGSSVPLPLVTAVSGLRSIKMASIAASTSPLLLFSFYFVSVLIPLGLFHSRVDVHCLITTPIRKLLCGQLSMRYCASDWEEDLKIHESYK